MAINSDRLARSRAFLENLSKQKFGESNMPKFFTLHTCESAADKGDRIRMLCPFYLSDATKYDPWIETQKYNLMVGGNFRTLTVPSFYGLPDPIITMRNRLQSSPDYEQQKKARQYNPKAEYLALIVDLNNPEAGVQIWQFGNIIREAFCSFLSSEEYNEWWDNENGHDIIIRKTGKKLETRYDVKLSRLNLPLQNAEQFQAEADKIDLARYIVVETEETIADIFNGTYDKEIARERRKKRDEELGHAPMPYFIPRESDPTPEGAAYTAKAKAEDVPVDKWGDPITDPAELAAQKSPKILHLESMWLNRTVQFYTAENGADPITGVVTEVLGDGYLVVGEYEVRPDDCTIMHKTEAPRIRQRAPEEPAPPISPKGASVADRVREIQNRMNNNNG